MFEETTSSLTEALNSAGWTAGDAAATPRTVAVDGPAEALALEGDLGAGA